MPGYGEDEDTQIESIDEMNGIGYSAKRRSVGHSRSIRGKIVPQKGQSAPVKHLRTVGEPNIITLAFLALLSAWSVLCPQLAKSFLKKKHNQLDNLI
jgi:hypothetical protein